MKIIVDTPEDYNMVKDKATIVSEVKGGTCCTCCACRWSNGCGYH
jgi:hypothetical protein